MASIEFTHQETDVTFYRTALDFLNGAVALHKNSGENPTIHSFVLLAGFCLEDGLKAYLCHKGYDGEKLKRAFGHNLVRAWEAAVSLGLDLDAAPPPWCEALYDICGKANPYVRYPKTNAGMVVPNMNQLLDDLAAVLAKVGAALGMDEKGNLV